MADQEDEIIDQSDIDKLLEASSVDIDESADDEEEMGELSQDDIDALMTGGGVVDTSSEEDYEEDYEEELDLISQDDINLIVSQKKGQVEDTPEITETAAEEEPITQEEPEIQEEPIAQNKPEIQEEIVEPVVNEESISLEDGVIDESESVSVEECLVTQEDIDQLIREDQDNPTTEDIVDPEEPILEQEIELEPVQDPLSIEEPVIEETAAQDEQLLEQETPLAEEPLSEIEPVPEEDTQLEQEVVQEEITTEQEVAMEEEREDTPEDIASDSEVVDLDEDDDLQAELDNIENDELQADVDSLLDDSGDDTDEGDWEQDSLISQDDIEELIKSSENEDEDALGDLDDLDSADDEDSLGENSGEEYEEDDEDEDYEEEDSKVILEESDESTDEKSKGKPEKKKKAKKKLSIKISKKFIIIAASVLFLASILSLAGFFFLKKGKNSIPEQRRMTAEVMSIKEPVVESVEINIDKKSSKPKVSRPMPTNSIIEPLIMKGFIILAPETIEGLAYIEVDIKIDYSNDNAYYEIKENMPFYRDVIYSAVQKALGSTKGDKITEPDLLVIVQKALQRAMPEGSIKEVSFKSFKAG
ncbi:MAG: hypothetical protein KAJ62_00950 [Desulfobacteraceae bacterium]|nr:hypothetical protein [Desulfobacteraceae bacterium]